MPIDTIYSPEEDSYLLVKYAKRLAFGDVLDLGCGSGIQGISLSDKKSVRSITFADINPKALEHAREAFQETGCKKSSFFAESDLFANLQNKKFDTIIFNPPYLPDDAFDDEKLITTGGNMGYELIERFLIDAKNHLNDEGIILLLFSSLTNKRIIDNILKLQNYDKNLIAKKALFMEQLFVYKLTIKPGIGIYRGHRGIVRVKKIDNRMLAIKTSLSDAYDPKKEGRFLEILNRYGIGPKLISFNDKELMMEFVEGTRILEYFSSDEAVKKDILSIIKYLLDQLYCMDTLGINKQELTNPYKHIIISKKSQKPIMIDFERCSYAKNPKNITQFIQFLCSKKLKYILEKKNITMNRARLLGIAQNYKRDLNKIDLKKSPIIEIIRCFD